MCVCVLQRKYIGAFARALKGIPVVRPEDIERRGAGFVTTHGTHVAGHGGTRSLSLSLSLALSRSRSLPLSPEGGRERFWLSRDSVGVSLALSLSLTASRSRETLSLTCHSLPHTLWGGGERDWETERERRQSERARESERERERVWNISCALPLVALAS